MADSRRLVSLSTAIALSGAALWANVAFSACAPPNSGPRTPQSRPVLRDVRVLINAAGVARLEYSGPPARFTFTNQDSVMHQLVSDPHPGHDRCPELNVGPLPPGASGLVSVELKGRPCGFHDETRPDDARFRGSIFIR
jgi:hypothetical protein